MSTRPCAWRRCSARVHGRRAALDIVGLGSGVARRHLVVGQRAARAGAGKCARCANRRRVRAARAAMARAAKSRRAARAHAESRAARVPSETPKPRNRGWSPDANGACRPSSRSASAPGTSSACRCSTGPMMVSADARRRASRQARCRPRALPRRRAPPGAAERPPAASRRSLPETSDRQQRRRPRRLPTPASGRRSSPCGSARVGEDALVRGGVDGGARTAWARLRPLPGLSSPAHRRPQHVLRREPGRAGHLRCGADARRGVSRRDAVRGAAGPARAAADRR